MIKCTNCSWEGEKATGPLNHCPVCGDNTDLTNKGSKVKSNDKIVIELPKSNKTMVEKVKDYVDDLKDDGKRNYSNRKKKGGKK